MMEAFTIGEGHDPKTSMLLGSYNAHQEGGEITHPKLEKVIGLIQGKLDEQAEGIRNDETLNATQRVEAMRELWDAATAAHHNAIELYKLNLVQEVEKHEAGLFRVPQAERDSTRNAYEMIRGTTYGFDGGDLEGIAEAHEELERYAERARRTGDRALARAVAHIAIERGIGDLRDAYLARDKDAAFHWQRYTDARLRQMDFEDTKARGLNLLSGRHALSQPPELWRSRVNLPDAKPGT